jgi:hypothetical protein
MLNNKKGQIGGTTTWIVATVIIVVLLIVFFYAANALATKSLIVDLKQSALSLGFLDDENLLDTKTSSAYLQTSEQIKKNVAESWIMTQKIDLGDYLENE